jgi:hypothetical protein
MKESTTYQGILEDGRIESLQQTLLRQGRRKFGTPSDTVTTAISALTDRERLERMTEQLLIVSNWEELLATP